MENEVEGTQEMKGVKIGGKRMLRKGESRHLGNSEPEDQEWPEAMT